MQRRITRSTAACQRELNERFPSLAFLVPDGEVTGRDDVLIAVLAGAVEERILRQLGAPDDRLVVVPEPKSERVP